MAHYSTEWHGPSEVTNDLSDLKGDYGLLSTVRRLWYRNTDSSTGSSDLTNAIKGTAASTGAADIAEYAITSNLAVVSGESDYTAYLRSSNFRFNIPAEATIVGVKIRWKGQSTSESGEVMDHHLYMVVDGSYSLAAEAAETPDDKGPDGAGSDAGLQSTSAGAWSVHTSTEGGTLDYELRQTTGSDDGSLGGYPIDQLTPAKVNSSSFGFVLSAQKERDNASAPWWDDYSGSPQHPSLEHTRMRVWYDISTPDSGNLRSSILNTWSGGLNSSYDETLWDPSGGQDDGTVDTGDYGRQCTASNTSHFTLADGGVSEVAHPMKTGASFAFSIWVYPTASSGTHHMMSKYASIGANSEYTMSRAAGNMTILMDAYDRGLGETSRTTAKGTLFTTGQWTHLVIDHNGYEMKFYSNGTYIESLLFPSGNDAQSANFCLGRRCASSLYSDDGYTKMGFWKSGGKGSFLLGQNNVDILYNSGLGLRYNSVPASLKGGLVGYWNLDEASGNAIDSHAGNTLSAAGSSDPGTLTGPATSSSYVTKTLATTSLKPTLHLGSRNRYIAAGREQSL